MMEAGCHNSDSQVASSGHGCGASSESGRKPCTSCKKDYSSAYLHITICQPVPSSISTSKRGPLSTVDLYDAIDEG